MAGKRSTSEQIIAKLRQVEVLPHRASRWPRRSERLG